MISNGLRLAMEQAYVWHHGQVDKNNTPYLVHVLDVMSTCMRNWPDDEDLHIAAVLHDIVEDTACELDSVYTSHGERVGMLVNAMTRREGESHKQYLERIKRCPDASKIKWADAIDNAREDRMIDEAHTSWYRKISREMQEDWMKDG